MDGDAFGIDGFGGFDGSLQFFQISPFMGRVNQRVVGVSVEAADEDTGSLGGFPRLLKIADSSVPEFHGSKAVIPGGLESVFPFQFSV